MATPFGLTVPFSVAPVGRTFVAAVVVTSGAGQPVGNERTAPFTIPPGFVAVTQKSYVLHGARPVRFAVNGAADEPDPIDTLVVAWVMPCRVSPHWNEASVADLTAQIATLTDTRDAVRIQLNDLRARIEKAINSGTDA